MKNLLSTHILYYKANNKYSAFKGAPCRNCNVQATGTAN